MDPIDYTVSVINCHFQPQPELEATATVFDLDARTLWQRTARLNISGNTYREVFSIHDLPHLARFLLVKLELKDTAGRSVADNFYWLPGRGTETYQALQGLPLVKLDRAVEVENLGEEKVVHIQVANPTRSIAFFVQLALTRAPQQEEILPVFWQDNYFTLLPGEVRKVSARIKARDLRDGKPVLEVGGWNIDTDFACRILKCQKDRLKVGEPLTVVADIANTFLDGSRVPLRVNGQVKETKWSWARGDRTEEVTFTLRFSKPGKYQLTVGERVWEVRVE
jgi:hypothetical protein